MQSPLVSVVIATYCRDESLERALISLADQTYSNFEIILVNDNKDSSYVVRAKEIIEAYLEKYPHICLKHIINAENMGSAKTRNIGIEAALGEYITFLDDDDVYLPEKIGTQLNGMIKCGADYSITDLLLYSENDRLVDRRVRDYIVNYDKKSLLEYHMKFHMTGTDTLMFKKEYLLSIGCFDSIDVGDEFYLMMKAIEGGGKLYYQPECYVKAYVHTGEGGLSSGQSKIDGENQLYEFKKIHFSEIGAKSRRYIKMRHHAVIAFAYLRSGNKFKFLIKGIWAVLQAPIQGIGLVLSRNKKGR